MTEELFAIEFSIYLTETDITDVIDIDFDDEVNIINYDCVTGRIGE